MRITRETLFKIARDTANKRARIDRDVLSIYLHGSLLTEEPMLGGTADIDLVFVHNDPVISEREIQRLTDEVHLDIAHHARDDYRRARALRLHPWMGPTIFRCQILYDPQHFMDFTQASVRGQYNRPDYVLGRARTQAEHAREMWFSMNEYSREPGMEEVRFYLRAVEHVANAVAVLNGAPLTERRLLIEFPSRAEAVGRPGLYAGLIGLLGGPKVDVEELRAWLPAWSAAYQSIPEEQLLPRLHPDRFFYYYRALEHLIGGEKPQDVLWPLLRTWSDAVERLPQDAEERQDWEQAFRQIELLGPGFTQRVAALDAFLDLVEETLEEWARSSGAEYRPTAGPSLR
jgi:hypothetical protein